MKYFDRDVSAWVEVLPAVPAPKRKSNPKVGKVVRGPSRPRVARMRYK
jgi:hypothetical protein